MGPATPDSHHRALLRALTKERATSVAAILYGVLALAATQVPLLNTLGFEFSFAVGLLVTLAGGPLAVVLTRRAYPATAPAAFRTVAAVAAVNLLLVAIPLAVILGAALFIKNCEMEEGLAFYGLLPGITALFVSSLGVFCAVHYRRAVLVYGAIVALTVAYAVALGYCTPAIFSYNFFYGFFPGLTYDELLPLTGTLVLFRAVTLAVGALLVWSAAVMARESRREERARAKGAALVRAVVRRPGLFVTLPALLALALLYAFRCDLGFESTRDHIRSTLGSSVTTRQFVIYFDSAASPGEEIRRMAAEHEFRLRQVMEAFALPSQAPIESYVYPSAEVKRRLIGAGVTSIAKPWSNQIHSAKDAIESSLKHELVHVVAARFGWPVIRASLSPGLVEGLAMAVEGNQGQRTHHEYAAGMRAVGIMPDIRSLMSPTGFVAQASSVSYTLAGSFCRYLIDRYGVARITQVYGGRSYDETYGRSLDDLTAEWQRFIARMDPAPGDTLAVQAMFLRPPLFRRVCPRQVARRIGEARRAFDQREYEKSSALFRTILDDVRGYESLSGAIASAMRLGQYDTVRALYRRHIAPADRPARYLPLFVLAGDAHWAGGDAATARQLYTVAARADLAPWLTEGSLLRLAALAADHAPEGYRRYFLTPPGDTARVSVAARLCRDLPRSCLAGYLHAQALLGIGRGAEAAAALAPIDSCSLDPRLHAVRLRTIGRVFFREGRFQEAKIAFWQSLNHVGSAAAREQIDDWLEYCDWMASVGAHILMEH